MEIPSSPPAFISRPIISRPVTIRRDSRKRARSPDTGPGLSSDPALFSADDVHSEGVENYFDARPRKKVQWEGGWWEHEEQSVTACPTLVLPCPTAGVSGASMSAGGINAPPTPPSSGTSIRVKGISSPRTTLSRTSYSAANVNQSKRPFLRSSSLMKEEDDLGYEDYSTYVMAQERPQLSRSDYGEVCRLVKEGIEQCSGEVDLSNKELDYLPPKVSAIISSER